MTKPAKNVLAEILAHKRQEIAAIKKNDAVLWRERAAAAPQPKDFLASLRACPQAPIIAEIKRRSPSNGDIRPDVSLTKQALSYQQAGAAAISVLTDEVFFGGSLQDIIQLRPLMDIPILRKDFIIDPIQLHQAKAAGADAILLIAAALGKDQMKELYDEAISLGLTVLWEVHGEEELEPVLALDPPLMGVNNRDLGSLKVDLQTSLRLRPLIPARTLVVAESGIQSPQDVARLLAGGLDAFLVGTALMRSADPLAALKSLLKVEKS